MKKGLYIYVLWFFVVLLINTFGWTEKSFMQRNIDIITGGFVGGGMFGVLWIIIGCVGLAGSFGGIAIGLPAFLLIGTLTGLGSTSFVHVLLDPNHYHINYIFILAIVVFGISASILINIYANRRKNDGHQQVYKEGDSQQERNGKIES